MKENTYDHINEYLNARISSNPEETEEVRGLIADFALLWNQYERALYDGEHHIGKIKRKINSFHLSEIFNLDDLFDRFLKYVEFRKYEFTYDGLKEMFKIRIKVEYFDEEGNRKFTDGDVFEQDLKTMVHASNDYEKVYCLLVIAAKVRNNMFHGNKGAWELPQQKELFRICNELLMSVLDISKLGNI